VRVILKPAGLLILLGAFGALLGVVFVLNHQMKLKAEGGFAAGSVALATASTPTKKPAPSQRTPNATLIDGGFEGSYMPVVIYDKKATLTGNVESAWQDDSSWAIVTVDYAKEETGCHSGKACQRIDITKVDRSASTPSVVQFNQSLLLKLGKRYRGSFFLKADRPVEAEVSFRQADWPYHYYGARVVQVGTNWTEAVTEAQLTESPKVYLMVKVWTPAKVWVDDASLKEEGS